MPEEVSINSDSKVTTFSSKLLRLDIKLKTSFELQTDVNLNNEKTSLTPSVMAPDFNLFYLIWSFISK